MIDAVLKLSLRYRILIVLGMFAFAGFSLWMLPNLNIDAFPDTTPVQVQINTYATGLAAEEVERQVTFPIEQEINGMPKLSQLRSLRLRVRPVWTTCASWPCHCRSTHRLLCYTTC